MYPAFRRITLQVPSSTGRDSISFHQTVCVRFASPDLFDGTVRRGFRFYVGDGLDAYNTASSQYAEIRDFFGSSPFSFFLSFIRKVFWLDLHGTMG